jgi:beta-phosphoglucomutase
MLKGVIFDMDGVLVDSHPIHLRAWRRLFQSIGKSLDDQDMEFILEGQKREDILGHFLGDLTDEQKTSYGNQKEILFREEASTIDTIPGVREFLDKLASESIAMGVASCGSRGRVNDLLNLLKLRQYFRVVITGDDVKEGKPDPTIFLVAKGRLGVSSSESLCVEDSVSGVTAAKAAGMKCLGIGANVRKRALMQAGADDVSPDFLSVSLIDLQTLF